MPATTTPRTSRAAATATTATTAKKTAAAKHPAKKTAKKVAGQSPSTKTPASRRTASATAAAKPALLSGGNPQIPKGYGDAPVQAYIAAMPGWKRDAWRRLDNLIERTVPGLRKAVKWNSPLYGAGDDDAGWFLGVHCFSHYIKVTFFRGSALRPLPPGESKMAHVRHLDIRQDEAIDEARFARWVKQASRLPGEKM